MPLQHGSMFHTGLDLISKDQEAHSFVISQKWERFFGNSTLHRGELIYIDELVSGLEITANSSQFRIDAAVQGSRKKPYFTRVSLLRSHDGFNVFTVCSCPVGSLCKHAAGILYSLEVALRAYEEAGSPPPDEIENWLNDIVSTVSQKEKKKAKPVRQSYALSYILSARDNGLLTLRLGKIKYTKDL